MKKMFLNFSMAHQKNLRDNWKSYGNWKIHRLEYSLYNVYLQYCVVKKIKKYFYKACFIQK